MSPRTTNFAGSLTFSAILLLLLMATASEGRRARSMPEVSTPATTTTELSKKQTVALHHAVKKLLGFQDSPVSKLEEGAGASFEVGAPNRKSNSLSPPQYMVDLYNKYKYGGISHDKMAGNTVRYIYADIGLVNGERMFLFNLSSVTRTERINSAALHIHRRRKSARSETFVSLYKVAATHVSDAGGVPLSRRASGWQATDVTSAVKKCVSARRSSSARGSELLAVSFRRRNKGKKFRSLQLERFTDHDSMPFLILFSNDTQNITLDHVEPHFKPADLEEHIVDPEFGYDPRLGKGRSTHQRRQPDMVDYDDDDDDHDDDGDYQERVASRENFEEEVLSFDGFGEEATDVEGRDENGAGATQPTVAMIANDTLDRSRRSIYDNQIPEDPVEGIKAPFNIPLTDPALFLHHVTPSEVEDKPHSRGKVAGRSREINKPVKHKYIDRRRKEDEESQKASSSEIFHDIKGDGADLIPYPQEFVERRRKNRRRNRRRNKKHRRRRPHNHERQLPLPPAWEAELKKDNVSRRGDRNSICSRRKLVIDFADIGWNDWIISPKSFEAHYCAGQCPFPLTEEVRPSNHATIQSLVHMIGIPAGVPAPCCAPDVLSSVSLLYFDGNKNVVLKHYPSMSVQSCACR